MTPTVVLRSGGLQIQTDSDAEVLVRAGDWAGLTRALRDVAEAHHTHGELILVPDGDVTHEAIISAIDAARAHFPHVVIAGGAS